MSKLLDYLNLLDADATAREAHTNDPGAAMTHFGLNDAEQETLMSGNKSDIAGMAGIDPAALPAPQVPNAPFN
jgi:hypothetical protein